ncbi:aminoacetone oxidase family FAD-binding enzyme [Pseudoroseomonas wenyumeiae]|uniref:Aminoacetone oxidase family FAD-binding enzyme n=1 Tax=Teichococcus wenyumeiae TaxID=2478470 RepID=A0A3A9JNT6_9PROT|nr:NAD(P)/FAD-dependent oxidoreductase [Pseudoroseomonas wenyumeiae]RKK02278.1 NAD(P)/FAD-dependent oxidoreductase [Pseudoroseomonas wenyumeiae]RMI20409.1 aminoacetone oxidase family FAD-binding enzyme [Pseudoroseomonas wenyumeiae]
MNHYDAIVLGAGAAGLMAAISAGQRGRKVLVLDHAPQVGSKILISGGGRCNFTNTGTVPDRFLSANPHFARSALARYTPRHFIELVQKHRIPFHEKTLGQLFCDHSARDIVAMLLAECTAAGVEIRTGTRVIEVSKPDHFRVETSRGTATAPALVLATGGLSIPKMGATGLSLDLARRFGLPLVETRPGLVPLTFEGEMLALMRPLSGVALPAVARAGRAKFPEAVLFTHRGLSGPAILQISSYWRPGQPIALDLLPGQDPTALLLERKKARPRAEPRTILAEFLPQRLAQALAEAWLPPAEMANQTDKALRAVGERLRSLSLTPAGTEGYAKAEVMLGGVDTNALSSRSLEAKAVPGLFVVGEAVDVTGWLGGYNFQWAWASGWCAGEAI